MFSISLTRQWQYTPITFRFKPADIVLPLSEKKTEYTESPHGTAKLQLHRLSAVALLSAFKIFIAQTATERTETTLFG